MEETKGLSFTQMKKELDTINEDELDSSEVALVYIDKAISDINMRAGLDLPTSQDMKDAWPGDYMTKPYPSLSYETSPQEVSMFVFDRTYVRNVIMPYVSSILQSNDGNMEGSMFYGKEYTEGLATLSIVMKDIIPAKFIKESTGTVRGDDKYNNFEVFK